MSTGANPTRPGPIGVPSQANGAAAASSLLQSRLEKGGSSSDEMTLLCGSPGEVLKVGAAMGVPMGVHEGRDETTLLCGQPGQMLRPWGCMAARCVVYSCDPTAPCIHMNGGFIPNPIPLVNTLTQDIAAGLHEAVMLYAMNPP